MIRWTKYAGNPVVGRPPGGAKVVGFRDPCVWKENDGWYMIVGTGIKGESGGALLFRFAGPAHLALSRSAMHG
jgi:Beta-fructosidases (levanase/invertase)